jgi:hypothetical protein
MATAKQVSYLKVLLSGMGSVERNKTIGSVVGYEIYGASNKKDYERMLSRLTVDEASKVISSLGKVISSLDPRTPAPAAAKPVAPFVSESAEVNGYAIDRGEDN